MASKQFQAVRLHFTTPLHLSRGQTDEYDHSEEIIHSDTLKSAIYVAARMLFGNKANESFFDSFKVSSAFPFAGKENFFPKPMIRLNIEFDGKKSESGKSKKLKKLTYINQSAFEELIGGKTVHVSEEQLSENGKFLFEGENKKVLKSEEQQRLAMPTGHEINGTPYHIERLYFGHDCGLFFLIDYENENETRLMLEAAIKLLGDEGIGTDKHIGNGIFSPEWTNLNLNVPDQATDYLTLSLYCPDKEEIKKELLEKSAYQLLKRGGYIASPENPDFLTFRKKSVYMFGESSVFPKEMEVKGKKVNLKPENVEGLDHAIWRDGSAFVIPIK